MTAGEPPVNAGAGGSAPYVAVIGPGAGAATEAEEVSAEAVGARLAARGAVVVCGGRGGVMAAACRGAAAEGGKSIGLLPGETRAEANPWVTVSVPTGLGEARNALVARAADAAIAIGGGYGTLAEIAFVLKLGRPVIGLGTWELARAGAPDRAIELASSAEDAVERALAALAR